MSHWLNYGRFLLLFTVLPILILLVPLPGAELVPRFGAAGVVLLAVYVFTTPWDNWAVRCRTWDFPAGRFWFRVGWLPLEEYLFFGLQSLLVMLLQVWQLRLGGGAGATLPGPGPADLAVAGPAALLLAAWAALGWWGRGRFTPASRWHYAWHLLYWFGPVVGLQWVVGWAIFLPRWDLLLLPTAAVGTWLVFGDLVAIRAGLWFFDERQITGWRWRRQVPWEEIAFFYLTSLVVAQSFLLFLPEPLR